MLALSILALFTGPLLYHWIPRGGPVAKTIDRLIVTVLVLVVVFLLVPEVLSDLGPWAIVILAVGYLLPGLLESAIRSAAHAFHLASLLLALAGLALHAMLDGAGLAGSRFTLHDTLAAVIVLHRLGVGLVLWVLVQPVFGRRAAIFVLLLVSATTVAGYYLSEWVLPLAGDHAVLVIQALITGAIVHSLVHRAHMEHGH